MKKIFLLVFTACAFAACSTDSDDITPKPTPSPEEELVEMTLSAGFEGDRTVLVGGKDVYFQYNDEINVYTGTEKPVVFTSDIKEGSAPNTNFNGLIKIAEGADMFVVYPSSQGSSEAMTTPGTITATIPATQTAIADTFDPSANISVAKVKDGKIILKNVCALMHFQISEADAANNYVKAVVTADKPLAGTVNINADDDEPTFDRENITGGSNTVTLHAPNGEEYFSAGDYYISLLPGEYTSVSIELYDEIGPVASKAKTGTATLTRSKRVKMNPIVDVLPGVFTVSETGRKVRFSTGNLWGDATDANNTIWHIEENQYQDMSEYDESHVRLIFNVGINNINKACLKNAPTTKIDQEPFFATDNFYVKDCALTWRVLTEEEMTYLLDHHSSAAWKKKLELDGAWYDGKSFYPDNYEGPDPNASTFPKTWSELNKAGIVYFHKPWYNNSGRTAKGDGMNYYIISGEKTSGGSYGSMKLYNWKESKVDVLWQNYALPVRLVTVVDPGN